MKSKQFSFLNTPHSHRFSHGGRLRKQRAGRKSRPLSTQDSIHLILKLDLRAIPKGLRHPKNFQIILAVIKQYQRRFFVKIEQLAIQRDHIHLMIKTSRRSNYIYFFRVLAGQIAQRMTDTFQTGYIGPRVWKERPFTTVTRSYRQRLNLKDYITLNELEARGKIPYQKHRLRNFTQAQRDKLRRLLPEQWWV